MEKNYFRRVMDLTPTKFWVNNVTRAEARLGIEAGALGCTQNPSYTWKILSHQEEGPYALELLRNALRQSDNDNEVQCTLQRELVRAISDLFMPLWERTGGRFGYVSIQGDPIHEDDPQVIIDEARNNRSMNPNVMIKIPATKAGIEAMGTLLAEDTPLNATEVMTLSQAVDLCEMYEVTANKTGKTPIMYYSVITGIFDEWLALQAQANHVDINPDVLYQAGMVVAKRIYQEVHDRGYRLGFIGGGFRQLHHFTEMVGADACITMNWVGSCDKLIEANPAVVSRFFNPVQPCVLEELLAKLPDFKRAYCRDGLTIEEYEEYGAVEYFRGMFVDSWKHALSKIAEERKKL